MKTIYLSILLLCLTHFAYSQDAGLDCSKFRTGKFYYPGIENAYSLRKEKTQESYFNGKLEAIWDVKWLDDCSFELICKKNIGGKFPTKKGDRIMARFVEINDDCFTIETYLVPTGDKNPEIVYGEMCKAIE